MTVVQQTILGGCVVGVRQYRMFWQLASSNTYLVVAMSKK